MQMETRELLFTVRFSSCLNILSKTPKKLLNSYTNIVLNNTLFIPVVKLIAVENTVL